MSTTTATVPAKHITRAMYHLLKGRRQAAHEFLVHGVEQEAMDELGEVIELPRRWA